jgi:Protein of unknown function (DUF3105)
MADTRKPKPKPGPTGKSQPGRGSGTAAKARPRDGRDARAGAKGRPADKGKLAKGAAARRLEAKRRRQRTIVWTGVAVVALLALVAVIVFQGRGGTAVNRPVSPAALEAGRQAAGSEGVKTFPEAGRDHIGNNEQPDNWNSNPPTSGDHLAAPQAAGVYDSEQDMRALVHNLEHGYVLILYKGIPQDQLDQLREFVGDRDGSKLVLAPYSGLAKDGVALVAWRNLELLQRVNLDVVQAFVNDFMVPGGSRSTAPEPAAA